jgi:hypothetical protein
MLLLFTITIPLIFVLGLLGILFILAGLRDRVLFTSK